MNISELQTPCLIADMEKVRANIQRMQEAATAFGCALRPHIKTHKSVEIAHQQLAQGACGITCAKLSEAEIFVGAGIVDIFVAYPLIGEMKFCRALALKKQVKRLILAIDSLAGAKALSDFAIAENTVFEVRLEVDTGAKRSGAVFDQLVEIGKALKVLPGLDVTGVYTFKSMIYENKATLDANAAGKEEGRFIAEAAAKLRGLGLRIDDISAGSTPTGLAAAETGLVNEIRPGTYVYHDWMTFKQGACRESDIATHIMATVVSTPTPELAVIDAGTKTLAADVRLYTPPLDFPGFAYVVGREDLVLDRMNEEHGMLRHVRNEKTGLTIGDRLRLIPAHICTAVNLHDDIYALEDGVFRKLLVDARGRVW